MIPPANELHEVAEAQHINQAVSTMRQDAKEGHYFSNLPEGPSCSAWKKVLEPSGYTVIATRKYYDDTHHCRVYWRATTSEDT